MEEFRPRLNKAQYELIKTYRGKSNERRVLVIGDLHAPFTLDGYLDHCVNVRDKYGCNEIIFIGDVIDSHYSSYHEQDPDGMGGGDELDLSIKELSKWYKEFPKAKVILGNHDLIVARKAFSSGLSKRWIRDLNEVLEVPNWDFVESYTLDDVLYIHGVGSKASGRIKKELHSVVQGHYHTEGNINYLVGRGYKIFGMQTGCGIDHEKYAFAYGKHFGKPFISCSVILNNGKLPILEPMEL